MKKAREKSRQQPNLELSVQIGATVRAAREAAKLTQADVAERVGLQPEVYGRLERGRMLPSVPTLFKLAVALGTSSDVMLGLAAELAEQVGKTLDDGLTPELRRLLRAVRKLDREQLKLFSLITNAFLRNGQKLGQQRPKNEDEHSTQLGI